MTTSEQVRSLAREGLSITDIARQLGIRYQHAYNILKAGTAATAPTRPAPYVSASIRTAPVGDEPDFSGALILVSCVSLKLAEPSPARLLYQSDWFLKVRAVVEKHGANWLILSALHGAVPPDAVIAPYEKTLNTAAAEERRAWALRVRAQLAPRLADQQRVVFFAGLRYREFLVPSLRLDGYKVEVPMEGLRIGEQLAWLAKRS